MELNELDPKQGLKELIKLTRDLSCWLKYEGTPFVHVSCEYQLSLPSPAPFPPPAGASLPNPPRREMHPCYQRHGTPPPKSGLKTRSHFGPGTVREV
jgi:hypothetical protein